jgi:hypothetical protein
MMSLYNREFLVTNLTFVYRMIVASAPLLVFAVPRSEGRLKRYYEHHLAEEIGHDTMLEEDLRRLGVEKIPHYHLAAQIAGSQYYLVAHEHAAALLGYMHVLESMALKPNVVAAVERAHGVELKAMRHHAEHDPGHVAELNEQIEALPAELKSLVNWNSRHIFRQLQNVISRMNNQVPLE